MSTTPHPAACATPTDDLAAELRAILTGAAFAPFTDRAFLRITGPDATRWLNGMVTNAVTALAAGEGCYNFLLNAQGRILGDCTIYRDPTPEPPAFLLETDTSQIEATQNHLDRFIIMDDVELAAISGDREGVIIVGPQAGQILERSGLGSAAASAIGVESAVWNNSPLDIIRPNRFLIPGFELWSDLTTTRELHFALEDAGAMQVSPAALNALRILSGTPRYGVDIRNTDKAHDLPQETAQDRALHFSKGCYLGQEIVERIRSRGAVHRTFAGFILVGELPATGAELTTESQPRPVGELTSVVAIPRAALDPSAGPGDLPLQLALGYIRREALDKNLALTYPGGTAKPAALPFAVSGLAAAQS